MRAPLKTALVSWAPSINIIISSSSIILNNIYRHLLGRGLQSL